MKPTEAIVNEIAKLSREFISLISDYSPEFSKRLKVHILLHLADDIRNFGPASLFNTERYKIHIIHVCTSCNSYLNIMDIVHVHVRAFKGSGEGHQNMMHVYMQFLLICVHNTCTK